MSEDFHYAICNEIYQGWDFAQACRSMKSLGYEGIEIAPFTLAEDPAELTAQQRRHFRQIIEQEGLRFVGLHWLMVSPRGLHVTTPDARLRRRSWQHVENLIELSADLGPEGILVFGSPSQRSSTGGASRQQATQYFIEGLAQVAPLAEQTRVTILIEALPRNQCDVVQSLQEAAAIVRQLNSPAIRTMFDVHNAIDEVEPHPDLVDKYFDLIRHVHVNELDGKHCGAGDYDFKPLLKKLKEKNYKHWISLEAFDFTPGAERIARESIEYLKAEAARIEQV
jgi:sugar phosphate isomerase/epimerase